MAASLMGRGMFDQGLKEAFIQPHTFLPERQLFRRLVVEREDRISHEGADRHDLGVLGSPAKGEPATADAAQLLPHDLVGLAEDGMPMAATLAQ
jgi:hypothetical protein